jgi:hypothetical protein
MHRSSVAPSAEQFPTKMRQNQSETVAHAVVIAIRGRKLQKRSASASASIAVVLLGLIAVQSWNLRLAYPDTGRPLQFLSAMDVMKEP